MAETTAVRPRAPKMVVIDGKEVDINSLNPKQRYQHYKNEKVRMAHDDDTSIITSKSKNTSTFVNLLNLHDKLLSEMLLSFGANPRITLEVLETTRQRSEEAKQMINTLNAEMASVLGKKYYAPRGFSNTGASKKEQTAATGKPEETKQVAAKKPKKKKAKKPAVKNATQGEETTPAIATPVAQHVGDHTPQHAAEAVV